MTHKILLQALCIVCIYQTLHQGILNVVAFLNFSSPPCAKQKANYYLYFSAVSILFAACQDFSLSVSPPVQKTGDHVK